MGCRSASENMLLSSVRPSWSGAVASASGGTAASGASVGIVGESTEVPVAVRSSSTSDAALSSETATASALPAARWTRVRRRTRGGRDAADGLSPASSAETGRRDAGATMGLDFTRGGVGATTTAGAVRGEGAVARR
ncbi:hypothetical protein DZF96_15015, partial [Clavibacter michiganensis]